MIDNLTIAFTGNVFPFSREMFYGGERMLLYLAEGLSSLGHDIYVFAQRGTHVPSAKDHIIVPPLENDRDVHYEAVKAYIEKTGVEFGIFQCNYFGNGWDPEVQERFNYCEFPWCAWAHAPFQLKQKGFNIVSCSKVLQADFKASGVDTTVINYGIPEELYRFQPLPENYAVWIGKIEGGKAPRLAIELAKAVGLKIVIMGPPYNTGCFWEQVAPYLDNETVFWVRGVDDNQKYKIMSRAKVFISSNENSWKEHFGIVNIEALAMGVPILGFNRIGQDSAIVTDEIIHHGVHGFILNYHDSNNLQEILDKGAPLLQNIDQIDRKACREHFEKNFTSKLMALRYEWFYQQIVSGKKFDTAEVPI